MVVIVPRSKVLNGEDNKQSLRVNWPCGEVTIGTGPCAARIGQVAQFYKIGVHDFPFILGAYGREILELENSDAGGSKAAEIKSQSISAIEVGKVAKRMVLMPCLAVVTPFV